MFTACELKLEGRVLINRSWEGALGCLLCPRLRMNGKAPRVGKFTNPESANNPDKLYIPVVKDSIVTTVFRVIEFQGVSLFSLPLGFFTSVNYT